MNQIKNKVISYFKEFQQEYDKAEKQETGYLLQYKYEDANLNIRFN